MNDLRKYLSHIVLGIAALLGGASQAWAQVTLGAASDFAVLGGTAITCTTSVITGDVGLSPGTAFTNTGCTIAGGTPPATNAAATDAQAALTAAYNSVRNGSCTPLTLANTGSTVGRNLSTLAGVTLAPGTYCIDDAAKTGLLTLDGPSSGIWIFKVLLTAAGDLTGTNFTVTMMGGGQACNVFWAPATAATMTTSVLKGTILAGGDTGSITLTGGNLVGRVLAKVAVTLTNASIVDCDTVSDSPSCKPRKHHGHHKDKHHGHDKDKNHGNDRDKDKGHGSDQHPFGKGGKK